MAASRDRTARHRKTGDFDGNARKSAAGTFVVVKAL